MADDGFITLPPGITDSSTLRRPRPERTVRPEHDEIVFVPVVPGIPPALPPEADPAEQPASQPSEAQPAAASPGIPDFQPPPAAPPAAASVSTASAETEDDAGETRISVSRHAASAWRLGIPGVAGPVAVESALFLGRNPTATVPGGKTLGIDDPAKSLSKTHALVEVADGVLYVTDLDSTNGVWVVPAGGEAIEVLPGARVAIPAGADLELGDVVIQVEHG
ncbi:MAG: FHA domain-containing protein [Rhodoglobus sp.]